MLKRIQHILATIPTSGTVVDFDELVDPSKIIIEIQGEAYGNTAYYDGSVLVAFAWQIPPVIYTANSSSFSVTFSEQPATDVVLSFQIIEYL